MPSSTNPGRHFASTVSRLSSLEAKVDQLSNSFTNILNELQNLVSAINTPGANVEPAIIKSDSFIDESLTISSIENGRSVGPIVLGTNGIVTIAEGSAWHIIPGE